MNLYLIGYRGSGKSSVAPLLAQHLDRQCVDTDQRIEIIAGATIANIFAEQGEAGFRKWETTVISNCATQHDLVVSLGGGAPTIADNRILLKKSGKTVWLTADARTLWNRISGDPTSAQNRPSLTDLDGLAEVQKLVAHRAGNYNECADYSIDTTNLTPEQIARNIANWFNTVDT